MLVVPAAPASGDNPGFGMAASRPYPFDRPSVPAEPARGPVGSGAQHTAHNSARRTMQSFMEQLRMTGSARHIWDVAVRRNGMTTSLALLGGVLVRRHGAAESTTSLAGCL